MKSSISKGKIFLFLLAGTAGVVAIICLLLFPVVSTLAGKGILAAKPNTNSKDRAANTLLAYAIRRFRFENGNPECIRLLLARGTSPKMPGYPSGWTPLMELGEFRSIVRDLVEAGANIETLADGMTASTARIPKAGTASASAPSNPAPPQRMRPAPDSRFPGGRDTEAYSGPRNSDQAIS